MYEIKIEVQPTFWNLWEKDKKNDETPYLIDRVAAICCSHPDPYRQEQGYEWALDNGNDWKAERREDVLIVAYRYGDGHADYMQILKTFLESSCVIGVRK